MPISINYYENYKSRIYWKSIGKVAKIIVLIILALRSILISNFYSSPDKVPVSISLIFFFIQIMLLFHF